MHFLLHSKRERIIHGSLNEIRILKCNESSNLNLSSRLVFRSLSPDVKGPIWGCTARKAKTQVLKNKRVQDCEQTMGKISFEIYHVFGRIRNLIERR